MTIIHYFLSISNFSLQPTAYGSGWTHDVSHYVKNPADIDVNFFGQLKEIIMPREKSYDDMTENERDQYERDNLEDEYYKTQAEMDGEEDDSNDKDWLMFNYADCHCRFIVWRSACQKGSLPKLAGFRINPN